MTTRNPLLTMRVRNLGVLDEGELQLGDFTVICGENNTGKTYATYALYALLRGARSWDYELPSLERLPKRSEGVIEIDLEREIIARWDELQKGIASAWLKSMPDSMAAAPDRFLATKLEVEIPLPVGYKERAYDTEEYVARGLSFGMTSGPLKLSISKEAGSTILRIAGRMPGKVRDAILKWVFGDLLLSHALPDVFMASAERTGAAIFHKELNFTRTRLLEVLSGLESAKDFRAEDVLGVFDVFRSRYPRPVRDNVDFVNQLDYVSSASGELVRQHPQLLEDFADILGGEFGIMSKTVVFNPRHGPDRLSLVESSSAVRSLLDVGFYLRHRAKPGDLLMIDEPELNLHPANQRRVARLLARLVNHGVRVFITTHSDYIAKEINTLLLLGKLGPEAAERHGYRADELLSAPQIALHVAHNVSRKSNGSSKRATKRNILERIMPLEDGGFEFPTFDDTIDKMNELHDRLWMELDAKEAAVR